MAMPFSSLSIEILECADGICTVRLEGELDLANAPSLRRAAAGWLTGHVILDLTPLDFIDSSGINAVVRLHRDLRERDRRLVLVLASPDGLVGRILTVAGLLDMLTTGTDVAAARAALLRT